MDGQMFFGFDFFETCKPKLKNAASWSLYLHPSSHRHLRLKCRYSEVRGRALVRAYRSQNAARESPLFAIASACVLYRDHDSGKVLSLVLLLWGSMQKATSLCHGTTDENRRGVLATAVSVIEESEEGD